jgi:hypothetical protein
MELSGNTNTCSDRYPYAYSYPHAYTDGYANSDAVTTRYAYPDTN